MSFVTITKPSVGDATRKSLADNIIDNLSDLNARLSSFASVALVNGSFEYDVDGDGIPDGWTQTLYTGGSGAISTTEHIHGAQSYSFTSTVLANGGGYLDLTDFFPVAEGKDYPITVWRWASVANISSKAEILWYDEAESYISTGTIDSTTNTPTTPTNAGTSIQAPAGARLAKIRLTGGVPGTGASTGTVYFDSVVFNDIASTTGRIVEAMIEAAAVSRSKLSTTTASGSTTTNSFTLTGSTYSWWTASASALVEFGNGNTAAGVIGLDNGGAATFYVDERYVQASPPYRYGPLFVTLLLDALGNIIGSQVAPDPIWAYHGPTDITPQYHRGNRAYRKRRMLNGQPLNLALADAATRRAFLQGDLAPTEEEVEVTLEYKDSDASVIWHPFGQLPPTATVLLVRPGTPMMDRLHDMLEEQGAGAVRDLFLDNHLQIDNTTGLALPGLPPGFQSYAARWKLTP